MTRSKMGCPEQQRQCTEPDSCQTISNMSPLVARTIGRSRTGWAPGLVNSSPSSPGWAQPAQMQLPGGDDDLGNADEPVTSRRLRRAEHLPAAPAVRAIFPGPRP
jgi:hypothetical protein